VHPFDDPDVIAGQGTIAMEILRQNPGPLHAVFVAIGGGGLISGVANYIKAVRPDIKIIGVQMNDSNAMVQSVAAKKRVTLPDVGLFSDGTAVKLVGEETFRVARKLVDSYIEVNTDAVCAAIKDVFVDTRSIVEPAGALAVAAVKQYVATHKTKGETYAVILCGANMNFDRLRFVAERAGVGEEREALFAVTIPEERGSFKRFCTLLGTLPAGRELSKSTTKNIAVEAINTPARVKNTPENDSSAPLSQRNITEFTYRISDANKAHVFVGLTTTVKGESVKVAQTLTKNGFKALDLTHDDLARDHIRHMVGGHSLLAKDERLLRFEFPERPGALMRFLSAMRPDWNISLFHYRNQGADYGRILVGLQVNTLDNKAFDAFLKTLGYPYVEETNNPVYRMFLKS
jgi:threonine dehydratase